MTWASVLKCECAGIKKEIKETGTLSMDGLLKVRNAWPSCSVVIVSVLKRNFCRVCDVPRRHGEMPYSSRVEGF